MVPDITYCLNLVCVKNLAKLDGVFYSGLVVILASWCLVTFPFSLPSSHAPKWGHSFYPGHYKEFVCQGQMSVANCEGGYHVRFTPDWTGRGHGYGGFALQKEYAVTSHTVFTAALRVGEVEAGAEKKMRAKFLVHVRCSDGQIWEICVEAGMWGDRNDQNFFDGVRTYRLDASSPPIIYLGFGHEPDEYVAHNYNLEQLFQQYETNVKPLTITEVAFEAWTNNVQAFSEGECIHAYFQAGNILEQATV